MVKFQALKSKRPVVDGREGLPQQDGDEANEDDAADDPQQYSDQVRLRWTF